ncbi:MAG: MerR family transcriptional regulator [Desulfobacterales bacterium]
MTHKNQYLISELAEEFGITTRSIRYYEKRGLISPGRSNGNYRIFSGKDRTRLRLILRGKRFGYSLDEIREMIGYWNSEPGEKEQIKKSLLYGDKKLSEIREKIEELRRLEDDLLGVRQKLVKRLENLKNNEPENKEDKKNDPGRTAGFKP